MNTVAPPLETGFLARDVPTSECGTVGNRPACGRRLTRSGGPIYNDAHLPHAAQL